MNNKLTKHHFAWAFLAIVFLVAGVLIYKNLTKDAIDPILRVLSDRLRETDYRLSIFGTSKQGVVGGQKKRHCIELLKMENQRIGFIHLRIQSEVSM